MTTADQFGLERVGADRYFDHGATCSARPPGVLAAVADWFQTLGVSAARGSGPRCDAVAARVAAVRQQAARWFGVSERRLVFTSGATESLNLALRGLLLPADLARPATPPLVLTTVLEHSSTVRPLRALERSGHCRIQRAPLGQDGRVDGGALQGLLASERPDLLVLVHGSNVTGEVLPVSELIGGAREVGTRVLVDAAQTAGYLDLASLQADVVVASGHKQLHGPPGVGVLAVRDDVSMHPHKQGGTGSSEALADQPEDWPTGWESGTPNTLGILGLGAALTWLEDVGPDVLLAHGRTLAARLEDGLRTLPGVILLPAATDRGDRLPIVPFTAAADDPQELAMALEGAGCQVRAGHHCAPWLHEALDRIPGPGRGRWRLGSVRLSPGPTTTADDVDHLLDVLGAILGPAA